MRHFVAITLAATLSVSGIAFAQEPSDNPVELPQAGQSQNLPSEIDTDPTVTGSVPENRGHLSERTPRYPSAPSSMGAGIWL